MTRKEAIELLKDVIGFVEDNQGRDYDTAFRMAIEALSERTGEWIFNPKDAIELMFTKPKCSECGFESADGGRFCSNCGAWMDHKER